jgi:HSP20 family protein
MANRDLAPWSGARAPTVFGRDPFASFRQQVDRLFDDFLVPGEPRSFAASNQAAVWPSVDVDENDKAYVVTAELPGIDRKDVELDLRDNLLTLRGEKREERKEENGGRRYVERSFGRFERSIPLAAEIDADKVDANFRDGVLRITLPKNAKAQDKSRRIDIKS